MCSWFKSKDQYPSDFSDVSTALEYRSHARTLDLLNFEFDNPAPNEFANIEQLYNLESLRIVSVNLDPFPFNLAALKKLRELTLEQCGLKAIPPEIAKLKNLRRLSISKNHSLGLSEILPKLSQLESLALADVAISIFPEGILSMRQLQGLHLADNTIQHLPDNLDVLQNLSYIYLGHNQLEELPTSIFRLPGLEMLFVHNNKLRTLPDAIADTRSLKVLCITGNPVKSLPPVLLDLSKKIDIQVDPQHKVLYDKTATGVPSPLKSTSIDFVTAPKFLAKEVRLNMNSLEFSEKLGSWEIQAYQGGEELNILVNEGPVREKIHGCIEECLARIERGWEQIQSNLVNSVLDLYNDEWSDPEGNLPQATPNQFLEHLPLNAITIMDDAVELYFENDELFAGHSIEIFWDFEADHMNEATLVG